MTPGTPEPRYKTRPGKFYTPPARTPLFSGTPRATRQYWPLATRTEAAMLAALKDDRWARRKDDNSSVCTPPGKSTLAAEIDVHPKTIARLYKSLEAKHFIQTELDYYRGTRKIKGKRVYVFGFSRALELRRADPAIALTSDQRVVYRGRGRRPMTPADAAEWHIDLANVPQGLDDEQYETIREEPFETILEEPFEAAPPADVLEIPLPAAATPASNPVYDALAANVSAEAPSLQDAADIVRRVAAFDPTIAAETIAAWIEDAYGAVRRRNPSQRLTAGWFIGSSQKPGKLTGYLDRHRRTQAELRAQEAKVARFERDSRINALAVSLDPAYDWDERERAMIAEQLATADPDEIAEARSHLERVQKTGA